MLLKGFEKYLKECRGAIHVGANNGGERDWYEAQGFKKVIWFEPNETIFHQLWKYLVFYPNHTAYPLGIHDTLKTATLNIASNRGESSSILPLALHAKYYPEIKYIGQQSIRLIRLDDFFTKWQKNWEDFNFLNIDTQGVELNVLKSLGENISKIDYIYTEVNEAELYEGNSMLKDIDEYLTEYGFTRVEMIMKSKHWGDALYVRKDLL
jgi:FkbM family methyltransferase